MINFPKNYFGEEERCNFKVNHMMKCAWAAQLEVLQVIEEICNRHNLQYYAYFGTLLGAVRHKGFIPWDDDMDIAMKREDYIRFFIYAKEELPEGYRILGPYTEEEWESNFSRIINSDQVDTSEERLKVYHGCPFAVGLDIFPLDYLPKNQQIRNMQRSMLELAKNSYYIMTYIKKCGEKGLSDIGDCKELLAENIKKIGEFTGMKRGENVSLNNWILQMFDAICMMGNGQDADSIGSFQIHLDQILTDEVKKETLDKALKMSFETVTIDVPIGYADALKNVYGRYRELKFSPSHTYPFYKKQIYVIQGQNVWNEDELNEIMNQNFDDYQLDNYGSTDAEPSEEWKHKLEQARAEGKQIVLFGTSLIDFMMQEEEYLHLLRNSLTEMDKNKNNIFVWWRPDKVEGYIYFYKHPEMEKEYKECLQYFEEHDLGILDKTEELVRALNRTDFYWGDETIAYDRYRESGRPCWLQEEKKLDDVLSQVAAR